MMCKRCVDLVREILPQVPEERRGELLMGATCFPLGDPDKDLKPQLVEISIMFSEGRLGPDLVAGACAFADAILSAECELSMLQERDWE
jgi:hypothetical protein